MASGFSGLSYVEISQIANNLRTKAENMQSLLAKVETELKKVGNDSTWSGTAASAAFEEFSKLIKKFPEFNEAITSCATYLDRVVATYQSVDRAVSGS